MKKILLLTCLLLSSQSVMAADVNPFSGKPLNLEDIQKDLELIKAYNQLQTEKAKAVEAGGTLELLPIRLKIEKQKLEEQIQPEAPAFIPPPVYTPPPQNYMMQPPVDQQPVYTPPPAPPVAVATPPKPVVKKKPVLTKPRKAPPVQTTEVTSTIDYKYSEKTGFMTFKNDTIETEIGKSVKVSDKSQAKYSIAENVDEQKSKKLPVATGGYPGLPSLPMPPSMPPSMPQYKK
jgi:hypothetical protein